jgi:HD superfamily phosphohydrolase
LGNFYEVRDPIHGFVRFNELERDIINHPAFQRLRRIRQLALTDMVYPGAMHTRFEHSLGVMHVATRLFDTLCERNKDLLDDEYKIDKDSRGRWRQIIRLAALLHDVGHTPFSHTLEELLAIDPITERPYAHEEYSATILEHVLGEIINGSKSAISLGIKASDVGFVFAGKKGLQSGLVWKPLISGQMDADRMDYLLRDSYHAGVAYGRYDLDRLAATVELCEAPEIGGHELGVGDDGVHAVEALLIARYLMFTQVYFHKTRAIYDHHLVQAMQKILEPDGGRFPPPTAEGVKDFLTWDDWRVLGAISSGQAGEHGAILRDRRHYRLVHETAETPTDDELSRIEEMQEALADRNAVIMSAEKSWYKANEDILVTVRDGAGSPHTEYLSRRSPIVKGMKRINQKRLYVPEQHREDAKRVVHRIRGAHA